MNRPFYALNSLGPFARSIIVNLLNNVFLCVSISTLLWKPLSYISDGSPMVFVAVAMPSNHSTKQSAQGSTLWRILFLVMVNNLPNNVSMQMMPHSGQENLTFGNLLGEERDLQGAVSHQYIVYWWGQNQRIVHGLFHINLKNPKAIGVLGIKIDVRCWVHIFKPLHTLEVHGSWADLGSHVLWHIHINYAFFLWTCCFYDVLGLQVMVIRVITVSGRYAHYRTFFQQLKILTVWNQYILNCVKYLKKNAFFYK